MPLIKSQHDAPALKDAVVLDLADVGRQAERLLASAHAKARSIIELALKEAGSRSEQVRSAGREEGHAEGYQKGYEAGLEKGRAEAMAAMSQRLAKIEQGWISAAGQWDEQTRALNEEVPQAALELALRLAERILHQAVRANRDAAVHQLRAALPLVFGARDLTVRVCPDDRPLLDQALPALMAQFSRFDHIRLVDDSGIQQGGCIIEHAHGQVDATLATQLRRAVELLMPAETADGAVVPLPEPAVEAVAVDQADPQPAREPAEVAR